MNTTNSDFSDSKVFDRWQHLAETDPSRFDEEKKAEIGKVISTAPLHLQAHLRMLQHSIDTELAKEPDAISRMNRSHEMMVEQFNDEKVGFKSIQGHLLEALEEAIDAKVICDTAHSLSPQISEDLKRIMKK